MKRKGLLTLSALVFFACLLGSGIPRVYGQAAATGAILGTVTDPSGAVVPGATVTTTDTRTQQTKTATTNATGYYDVESLAASTNDVTIKMEGFRTFVSQGVKIDPNQRMELNSTLQLGSATSEVTEARAALNVQATSGDFHGINGRQ